MSASEPETSIYTTDTVDDVRNKIWNAFTGGRATTAEQRRDGGDPNVCTVFQYFAYLFEEDDRKLAQREIKCKTGEILCGECKKELTERVNKFLTNHQRKREKARNTVDKFYINR